MPVLGFILNIKKCVLCLYCYREKKEEIAETSEH